MENKLNSYNPETFELLGSVDITNTNEIDKIVEKSKQAQTKWAKLSVDERISYLQKAGEVLNRRSQELAKLLSQEMGKDFNRATGEVIGCANDIIYKANEVKNAIKTQVFDKHGVKTELQYNALGVCAVISPWNYPMAMAHWVIIPALVAGNSVVYKPSEETPLIAKEYVEIFQSVLPKDVLQVVFGAEDQGKALVKSNVNLITFTGSKDVGKNIMKNASDGLKRLILELGGKDPLIVLNDANIDRAARFAVASSFENAGQMCTSSERIYVSKEIEEQFIQRVITYAKNYQVGSWNHPDTDIGPIINENQRTIIRKHIKDAIEKGATHHLGDINRNDSFIEPTVLSNVKDDMLVFKEETFGPVVAISSFETLNEVIKRANSSDYALGASIFGRKDVDIVATELDAGMLGINQGNGSIGDTPWVGAKQSGFGYHGSADGHRQFTQPKVVTRRNR